MAGVHWEVQREIVSEALLDIEFATRREEFEARARRRHSLDNSTAQERAQVREFTRSCLIAATLLLAASAFCLIKIWGCL